MKDKLINLIKNQVRNVLSQDPEIPEGKREETVNATTGSLVDGLQQYMTPENIPAIASLLGKGTAAEYGFESSSMLSGIQSKIVSILTSKVGLKPQLAEKIAVSVIPAVTNFLSKETGDGKGSFNLGSLISSFRGGNDRSGQNSADGLMDKIGSLLGKG